jgi:hypothetical protein
MALRVIRLAVENVNNDAVSNSRQLQIGGTASLLPRFVFRRYLSNNCLVIIWRKFNEGEGVFSGMHSNASGWCWLRPSSTETVCAPVPKYLSALSMDLKVGQILEMVLDIWQKITKKTSSRSEAWTVNVY